MRWRDVERKLRNHHAYQTGSRRSHFYWEATGEVDDVTVVCRTTVVHHSTDIPLGTLRAIERDMGPLFGAKWMSA